MQHDNVLKKLNFDLLTTSPGSGGVWGLRAKYLLPCCCFRDSLNCDMQGNHVLKKSSFDPRVEGGGDRGRRGEGEKGSAVKICATMLLHS